mmetsp:Transcript_1641/g.2742  ORF Transcript_1641/g.2742 Transcript_1641/m.2742 type:complete len:211 (-) Transcript_1641:528-1160(-)
MDTALSLGTSVLLGQTNEAAFPLARVVEPLGLVALELKVLEGHATVFRDRDGVLGISDGWISLCVKGVVRNLILCDVVKAVLEGPVSERVALSKAAANRGVLEKVNPSTLKALPSGSAVDHAVSLQGLETSLERLDLAHLVVLVDVLLPKVSSILLVVSGLVPNRDALGAEHFGLEAVKVLNFPQEVHGLGEEVEGVNAHHRALSVLEVS